MSIDAIVRGIQSQDAKTQHHATQSCRRMLSREKQPPIDAIIQAGVIPRLVTFLAKTDACVCGIIQNLKIVVVFLLIF